MRRTVGALVHEALDVHHGIRGQGNYIMAGVGNAPDLILANQNGLDTIRFQAGGTEVLNESQTSPAPADPPPVGNITDLHDQNELGFWAVMRNESQPGAGVVRVSHRLSVISGAGNMVHTMRWNGTAGRFETAVSGFATQNVSAITGDTVNFHAIGQLTISQGGGGADELHLYQDSTIASIFNGTLPVPAASTFGGIALGANNSPVANPWSGSYAEVIITRGNVLALAANIMNYLKTKWGTP
jgi:hypothetical protein